jgi:hypothetical protein
LYTKNNFFFLMSTNSFFFSLQFIAPMGGCPSPWACGAYPRAGHVLLIRDIDLIKSYIITQTLVMLHDMHHNIGMDDK